MGQGRGGAADRTCFSDLRQRAPSVSPAPLDGPRDRALFALSNGYVWRHLPLNDVHPDAQMAAEAAEAAASQGAFWRMHDVLLNEQDKLQAPELVRHAEQLGLDLEPFRNLSNAANTRPG